MTQPDGCTCASDGNAHRCPHHTQADFEAMAAERPSLEADKLTVEYDGFRGQHAIVLVPFPHEDTGGLVITGTAAELRGVVDTMDRLVTDLEEDS